MERTEVTGLDRLLLRSALLHWRLICVARGYYHAESTEALGATQRHDLIAMR